jgi:hypothetical protein
MFSQTGRGAAIEPETMEGRAESAGFTFSSLFGQS